MFLGRLLVLYVLFHVSKGEEQLLLVLGGAGQPSVGLYNQECDIKCQVQIPDVPQPFGKPGRVGSYAASYVGGDSVIVCGGLEDFGPQISSFDDCQILDLKTLEWTSMNMANYSAHGVTARVDDQFLIFGGEHRDYETIGPSEWIKHNQIQKLNLSTLLDSQATWTILQEPTYNDDPFIGSCAVVIDGNVWMSYGSNVVSFDLDKEKWVALLPNVGISGRRYGCTLVQSEFHYFMVFVGGDYELATAFDFLTGNILELPQPRYKRPHRPILTTVGSHIVVHGGDYNNGEFVTEEALDWNNMEAGWQERTVRDVSRVDSPGVLVSAHLFPHCSCQREN